MKYIVLSLISILVYSDSPAEHNFPSLTTITMVYKFQEICMITSLFFSLLIMNNGLILQLFSIQGRLLCNHNKNKTRKKAHLVIFASMIVCYIVMLTSATKSSAGLQRRCACPRETTFNNNMLLQN